MTHGELAAELEFEQKTINYDIELRKEQYKKGIINIPPRNNLKLYPLLTRTLNHMSRRSNRAYENPEFLRIYKPLIVLEDGKWSITNYGVQSLNEMEHRHAEIS